MFTRSQLFKFQNCSGNIHTVGCRIMKEEFWFKGVFKNTLKLQLITVLFSDNCFEIKTKHYSWLRTIMFFERNRDREICVKYWTQS